MTWISKWPPQYAGEGDKWFCEKTQLTHEFSERGWVIGEQVTPHTMKFRKLTSPYLGTQNG